MYYVFGIWRLPTLNESSTWTNFKSTMNSWGNLKWLIEEQTNLTHFLDLNITIQKSSLSFSTFQKPLNLYLHIPYTLTPPPIGPYRNILTVVLRGSLRGTQQILATKSMKDFQELVTKFIKRLNAQGHLIENLHPIFMQAAAALDGTITLKSNTDTSDTLFIHWTHHPYGVQCSNIHHTYTIKLYSPTIFMTEL
jgi:hypothetical protein